MRERVHAQELFLRRDDVGQIFGRTGEVEAARTFLGEANQFLVIHGAGGIGKTRLLLEIGETIAVSECLTDDTQRARVERQQRAAMRLRHAVPQQATLTQRANQRPATPIDITFA